MKNIDAEIRTARNLALHAKANADIMTKCAEALESQPDADTIKVVAEVLRDEAKNFIDDMKHWNYKANNLHIERQGLRR